MNGITLLLSLALAATAAQSDQVYKWTDANGVTHFTDQPPAQGTKFDKVQINADLGKMGTQDSSNPPSTATDSTSVNASGKNQPAPVPENPVQAMAKACEQSRAQLELLQSKHQVSMDTKGNGQAQVLDDAARKAEIVKAQEAVAAYCK